MLPYAGGIFDQDPYYMLLVKAGLMAFDKKQELEDKKAQAKRH